MSTGESPASSTESWTEHNVEWAAVCDCGWSISSTGTSASRTRIEQLGETHAKKCDDTISLERRHDNRTEHVRDLTGRWSE